MKSDLDLLIEQYEEERASLEKKVAEYLAEEDFVYASHHQKALWQVRGHLDHLYKMRIPFYEDISQLEKLKLLSTRAQENEKHEFLSDYWKRQIEEHEIKIKELSGHTPKPFYDGQVIDDALFDLVEHKLKGFRLCFREEPEICIEFKLDEGFIEVALPADLSLQEFDPEDDDNWQHIGIFTGLGFQTDENNRLVYKYPLSQFKDASAIKILLARLMYDVFYYNEKYDSAKLICY